MTHATWHLRKEEPSHRSANIEKRYACSKIVASVLSARDIVDPQDLRFFLERDIQHHHNPFLLDEMDKAVDCVTCAVKEKRKILVYGDRDVDGITSTVLMVESLESIGGDVTWQVPTGDSPYGFTTEVVESFAEKGGGLLVAVDCGSTSIEEIRLARERGIEVVVVDHHDLRAELPPAQAIVNPKMSDSSYPFASLCACALVAKFIWALQFSQTELYNKPICFCVLRPGNHTLIVDAVRTVNFVEESRISEALVPELGAYAASRLPDFFRDAQIFVYDEAVFRKLFAAVTEDYDLLDIVDLAPLLQKQFPQLRGKSLLQMRDKSQARKYSEDFGEIDVLRLVGLRYLDIAYPQVTETFRACLEFVAIATIADMMPLWDENRIFVHHGVETLNTKLHKGLSCLLEASNHMKSRYTAGDVGWYITPLINATGRMGQAEIAVRLLLESTEPQERTQLAQTTVTLNLQRKKICERAWDKLIGEVRKTLEETEKKLLWVFDASLPRGTTGLIAGRFAQYFGVPALVFSITSDKRYLVGSIRSSGNFDATAYLATLQHIFVGWGGHTAAAGFHLHAERREEFVDALRSSVKDMSAYTEIEETIEVDMELSGPTLTPDLYDDIETLAPFGMDHAPVTFLLRKAKLEKVEFIGAAENHLRLFFLYHETRWGGIYWNASNALGKKFAQGDFVDLVFHFEKNHFRASETLRFHVLDMKKTLDAVSSVD